jgi:hypothetical protein
MPNNIINHVRVIGSDVVEKMQKYFKPSIAGLIFDFNLIIPIPKNVTNYNDGTSPLTVHHYCCDYWGTKWNAYQLCFKDYNNFNFQTAWNTPKPIFKKLSQMEPGLTFIIKYADEDLGDNCGSYVYLNGDLIEEHNFPMYSLSSREFAIDLWDTLSDIELESSSDSDSDSDSDLNEESPIQYQL